MRATREDVPQAPEPPPITVALIEDNRVVRDGMVSLMNRRRDVRVVAAGATLDVVHELPAVPQVVLLDIGLEQDDSLAVARAVQRDFPQSAVIVMDLLPVHEELVAFVNAGVRGFVIKDATLDDLAETIRSVAAGQSVLPPPMLSTLFSQIARETLGRGRHESKAASQLTPREREVVELIAVGLANKEIAARLGIATHTVKSHVRNVMDKLQLHTRLEISARLHGDA